MSLLQDPFLASLVARLMKPGVIGVALAGSYARGENGNHSDVDLDIFVEEPPMEGYTLQFINGKLVSLKYICMRDEYDSLTKPESAVWAVPGLSQMQILQDETEQIAKLKQAALDFKWSSLQSVADKYAIEKLACCAEEAHKIMDGLIQKNESKVMYASWGMFKELSNAVSVQAGLMIDSENRYFDIIQNHLGREHVWTRSFRLSFGMDGGNSKISAYQTRGKAALDLYAQTAILFKNIFNERHREVIENTLELITSSQKGCGYE